MVHIFSYTTRKKDNIKIKNPQIFKDKKDLPLSKTDSYRFRKKAESVDLQESKKHKYNVDSGQKVNSKLCLISEKGF